jgi:hypothetical protein
MEPYVEEYRVEDAVMHVRLSGTYPNARLASSENLFQPLIEACRRGNCRRVIVDARELQVNFNTAALFRAGVDAATLNEFNLCVALVARKDMISPFFDDVIRNRCARVEVFKELESARSWIDEMEGALTNRNIITGGNA